jgi:hypothetical protein
LTGVAEDGQGGGRHRPILHERNARPRRPEAPWHRHAGVMTNPADEPRAGLDALSDRLADDVLILRSRPNALTRFSNERGGPRGCLAGLAGLAASLGGTLQRTRHAEYLSIRDDYASLMGADATRASDDYHYVRRRVAVLSTASDGDPTLVQPAARLLFRYVGAGRPANRRLHGPEDAFDAIRAHFDGPPDRDGAYAVTARYIDAWRTAINASG